MLKPLLKGDPAKPKEEELDESIECQLASLGQMKDLVSSLKPNEKRLWNDVLAGMVRNLSKRRRRRVTTQVVESHDMEVAAQDASNTGQIMSSEETARIDQE